MQNTNTHTPQIKVHSMDQSGLTTEQVAAAFARFSRSPETVLENVQETLKADTARFHSKWTLDYGHSSIAEHAPVQLALENISRVVCDIVESGRLSSYTEKSSRFQSFQPHQFATPPELEDHPDLLDEYSTLCFQLIETANTTEQVLLAHLEKTAPDSQNKARQAKDAARALLPASVLTSVGITLNARSLAHTVSKLLSHPLQEAHRLAGEITAATAEQLPTLLRHAEYHPTLAPPEQTLQPYVEPDPQAEHRPQMLNHNPGGERIICAALLFSQGMSFELAEETAQAMPPDERNAMLNAHSEAAGRHAHLPREFELAACRIALTLDYGALRELNRHRLQTNLNQPLQTALGVNIPKLAADAGAEATFTRAANMTDDLHARIRDRAGARAAQYIVLHCHWQRTQINTNLRQLHNLLRLRTRPNVHPSLRSQMLTVLQLCHEAHPGIFPEAFS